MFRRLLGAVVGLALAGMVTAAQAVTLKFEFTGTISGALPNSTIDAGDSFSAMFLLDLDAPTSGGGATIAIYPEAQSSIDIVIDGATPSDLPATPVNVVAVEQDGITDFDRLSLGFNFDGTSAPFTSGTFGTGGGIQFRYEAGYNELFSSTDLDLSSLIVSSLSSAALSGVAWSPDGPETPLIFETASVQIIPVPAALPLFATALAGMGLFGWRKNRAAA